MVIGSRIAPWVAATSRVQGGNGAADLRAAEVVAGHDHLGGLGAAGEGV